MLGVCASCTGESPIALHLTHTWDGDHLDGAFPTLLYDPALAQVLDLGITRELVRRLVSIFSSMCAVHEPVCGSFAATYAEAYRSLLDWERRSKASNVKPGYAWGDILLCVTVFLICSSGTCCRRSMSTTDHEIAAACMFPCLFVPTSGLLDVIIYWFAATSSPMMRSRQHTRVGSSDMMCESCRFWSRGCLIAAIPSPRLRLRDVTLRRMRKAAQRPSSSWRRCAAGRKTRMLSLSLITRHHPFPARARTSRAPKASLTRISTELLLTTRRFSQLSLRCSRNTPRWLVALLAAWVRPLVSR